MSHWIYILLIKLEKWCYYFDITHMDFSPFRTTGTFCSPQNLLWFIEPFFFFFFLLSHNMTLIVVAFVVPKVSITISALRVFSKGLGIMADVIWDFCLSDLFLNLHQLMIAFHVNSYTVSIQRKIGTSKHHYITLSMHRFPTPRNQELFLSPYNWPRGNCT